MRPALLLNTEFTELVSSERQEKLQTKVSDTDQDQAFLKDPDLVCTPGSGQKFYKICGRKK